MTTSPLRPARRLLGLLLAASLSAGTTTAFAQSDANSVADPAAAQLTFDALFAEDGHARAPGQFAWSALGDRLAYAWAETEGEDAVLFVLSPSSGDTLRLGTATELLGAAEIGAGTDTTDASPHPILGGEDFDSIAWFPAQGNAAEDLLVAVRDGLYRIALDSRKATTILENTAPLSDIKVSPTGRQIAFHRDLELWVRDLETGEERAVTRGAIRDRILNAETDWVYWEEIWGRDADAYWWSPDGRKIAYYQFDEEPVASYPLVNFIPVYPEVEWQKYPKAGSTNPRVRVGVVDVESGQTQWMYTAAEEETYLARIGWSNHDGRLMVQRLNREQNQLDLLRCHPTHGECRTVLTESHPTWVNLENDYRYLDDGRILWGSERSGWRRLYLYDADGGLLRAVTPDGWNVTSLDAVVDNTSILFSAYRTKELGGVHRSVLQASLETDEATVIVDTPGWNSVTAGPRGTWVHRWSDANTETTLAVRDADGQQRTELPSQQATRYDATLLPHAEFLMIDGPGDARLPATMIKPRDFDPSQRYPVIMYHYGGPDSQVVRDVWGSRGRGLWHKMMAERGYLIFSVDNEASIFFGKAGEDKVHRRFGEVNLAAQLAAVEYLTQLDYVDADRIGLWGWSGGGSNTLYCLTRAPGVWKAGMSGAPVTDWRLYDTIWTERYLDHPKDNPDGYVDSSAVTHADKLEDALLIVHGTADDNVHPANTIAYTQKLIEAGLPFDEAIYPRQKHGLRGKASRHFYEKMTQFFDRELAASKAPTVSRTESPSGR